MTDKKEEIAHKILEKYQAERLHATVYGGFNLNPDYYCKKDVISAMTEYADSQAKERAVELDKAVRLLKMAKRIIHIYADRDKFNVNCVDMKEIEKYLLEREVNIH